MVADRQSLQLEFQRFADAALVALLRSGGMTELAQEVATAELRKRGVVIPSAEAQTAPTPGPALIDDDLVPVAQLSTAGEAYLLQGRLESEGVPAVVADANFVQVLPLLSLEIGVRVLVPASFLDSARDIVQAIARGDYALDDKADDR
jgi:hypothetical protein